MVVPGGTSQNLSNPAVFEVSLEPNDARRLASLCGQFDQHLRQIEERLDVKIRNRGNLFSIDGPQNSAKSAQTVIETLYQETTEASLLTPEQVHLHLLGFEPEESSENSDDDSVTIRTKKESIKPRGQRQIDYVRKVRW